MSPPSYILWAAKVDIYCITMIFNEFRSFEKGFRIIRCELHDKWAIVRSAFFPERHVECLVVISSMLIVCEHLRIHISSMKHMISFYFYPRIDHRCVDKLSSFQTLVGLMSLKVVFLNSPELRNDERVSSMARVYELSLFAYLDHASTCQLALVHHRCHDKLRAS